MSEDLKIALKEHMAADQMLFEKVSDTLQNIKENHLAHMQASSAATQADISWIKKILWLVLVPVATSFVEQIYKLIHP